MTPTGSVHLESDGSVVSARRRGRKRKRGGRQPKQIPRAKQRKLSGGGRRASTGIDVPLVTDLSLEPAFKYSLERVADGSPSLKSWTSYRLKSVTMFLETESQRFQIEREGSLGASKKKAASSAPSSGAGDGYDTYRMSLVKNPARLNCAQSIVFGIPLPQAETETVFDGLDWGELQWSHVGVVVRGKPFELRSVRCMANCEPTLPLPSAGHRKLSGSSGSASSRAAGRKSAPLAAALLADLAEFRAEAMLRQHVLRSTLPGRSAVGAVDASAPEPAVASSSSRAAETGKAVREIASLGTGAGKGSAGSRSKQSGWRGTEELQSRVDAILSRIDLAKTDAVGK